MKIPNDTWTEFVGLTLDTTVMIYTGMLTADFDYLEKLIKDDVVPGVYRMVMAYELDSEQKELTSKFVDVLELTLNTIKKMKDNNATFDS